MDVVFRSMMHDRSASESARLGLRLMDECAKGIPSVGWEALGHGLEDVVREQRILLVQRARARWHRALQDGGLIVVQPIDPGVEDKLRQTVHFAPNQELSDSRSPAGHHSLRQSSADRRARTVDDPWRSLWAFARCST